MFAEPCGNIRFVKKFFPDAKGISRIYSSAEMAKREHKQVSELRTYDEVVLTYKLQPVLYDKLLYVTSTRNGVTTFVQCNQSSPKKTLLLRWFQSNSRGVERTKRISLVPVKPDPGERATFRSLLKPFLFTVSVCGCSYVGATVWQYETIHKNAMRMSTFGFRPPQNYKQGYLRREMNRYWNTLTEGQKVVAGIIAANGLVFLLWRVPALQPILAKYFSASPASKNVCLPMLLSTFSHYSFFHFAANMYVLYSFSNVAVNLFGKEQFLGFYISSGVVSSFVSYIHKVVTRSPSFSLGASGALMSVLAAVCFQFPNSQLGIVFLPFFTFQAGTISFVQGPYGVIMNLLYFCFYTGSAVESILQAIKCVMGLDAVGLALGWKFLDHAAHLGGSLFGIAYLWYGQDLIWRNREPLLHWWHAIRQPKKND